MKKAKGKRKKIKGRRKKKKEGEKRKRHEKKKEKQIKKKKKWGKREKRERKGVREGKKAVLPSCWSTLQVPQSASDLPVPRDGDTHSHGDKQLQPLTRRSKTSFYFQMLQF